MINLKKSSYMMNVISDGEEVILRKINDPLLFVIPFLGIYINEINRLGGGEKMEIIISEVEKANMEGLSVEQ